MKKTNQKAATWAELKAFCNEIPDQFLSEQVRWWGDERGGIINLCSKIEEDMICTEEGWEPRSVYDDEDTYTQEEIKKMPVLLKGAPVLFTDF